MKKTSRIRTQDICSDIMLNYNLFQKFKLMKKDKFNHLIDTLMIIIWKF
jgi:hypothetical protein